MISLDFTDVHLERNRPRDAVEVPLGVVATFSLVVEHIELFSEGAFSIVELAAQLKYWLDHGDDESDFKYKSAEAAEILLWFKHEPEGWRAGSD